jgi:pyridoxamine 5'-phosphate oxidase
MDKNTLQDLREDYRKSTLEEKNASQNPFTQFDNWFQEALRAEIPEPNAMVIATSNKEGFPSARVVLLKGFDEKGFIFYTNYESQKGKELSNNPKCALVFNWLELERQIRIEGIAEKLSPEESTAYFHKRPKKSQIGAWASPQSEVIETRDVLEDNLTNLNAKYMDSENLPRPKHWGGFRIKATRIEFWQGRSSRLHDRLNYEKNADNTWKRSRLAP